MPSNSASVLIQIFVLCIIPITTISLQNHNNLRQHSTYKGNSYSTMRDTSNDEVHSSSRPYFLKVPEMVTVLEGSTVILSCRIENLDDGNMVIWIRNSDLQILTAGHSTFSSDVRFKVNHENVIDSTDWSLVITNARIEDQGQYECQVNTDPKMKLNINLIVKEISEVMDSPFFHHGGATIEGKNLNIVKQNSTITLTCKIMENEIVDEKKKQQDSRRIEWKKNGEQFSIKTRLGGFGIESEWDDRMGTSRLTLGHLQLDDNGEYSCISNGLESESVTLQVVSTFKGDVAQFSSNIGEPSASVQKSSISIIISFLFASMLYWSFVSNL